MTNSSEASHALFSDKLIDFVKFAFGTTIVGIVTVYLNHQYQVAQLELEKEKSWSVLALEERKARHSIDLEDKKAEFEYLGKFTDHSMKEDLKVQLQFADYMRSVALSQNMRDIWGKYFTILQDKYKNWEAEIKALKQKEQQSVKELATLTTEKRPDPDEVLRQAKEIKGIQLELHLLQQKLDKERASAEFFDFESLFTKAEAARRAGHYKEQRDLLLQLSERAPPSLLPFILANLAIASRSLRDFRNARIYMERAVALGQRTPGQLVNLAIMQKNDQQLDRALESLRDARSLARTELQKLSIDLITAGYHIHNNERDKGLGLFDSIKDKLLSDGFSVNLAWFYAVAERKIDFYREFERSLQVNTERTLEWVTQEVDIDKYRNEERFKAMVAKYRAR